MEQMKVSKWYMDEKLKEMKTKYRSQGEVVAKFNELMKIIKINECQLNIDTLMGSKIDVKVVGVIFQEIHLLDKIEIFADRMLPEDVHKSYLVKSKEMAKMKLSKADAQVMKRISQNPNESFGVIAGLGKNLMKVQGEQV